MQKKITSALRNTILPHQRNYAHVFIGNGKTVTENDYTPEELNSLRQAIVNHEYVLNNTPDLKNKIDAVRSHIAEENNEKSTPLLSRYTERVIDYPDYKQVYVSDDYGNETPVNFNHVTLDQWHRLKNTKNPDFFMQGTIGAADYDIDKNGNVTLKDRYDFTQDKIKDIAHYSLPALVAKAFGKPYDVNIKLGNINDWGMKYSGYNNILDQADWIMNNPTYKLKQELKSKGVKNY